MWSTWGQAGGNRATHPLQRRGYACPTAPLSSSPPEACPALRANNGLSVFLDSTSKGGENVWFLQAISLCTCLSFLELLRHSCSSSEVSPSATHVHTTDAPLTMSFFCIYTFAFSQRTIAFMQTYKNTHPREFTAQWSLVNYRSCKRPIWS